MLLRREKTPPKSTGCTLLLRSERTEPKKHKQGNNHAAKFERTSLSQQVVLCC
jgi:hypothetical protein